MNRRVTVTPPPGVGVIIRDGRKYVTDRDARRIADEIAHRYRELLDRLAAYG